MDSICAENRQKSLDGWTMEALSHILCRCASLNCPLILWPEGPWHSMSCCLLPLPAVQNKPLLGNDTGCLAGFWTLQHFLRPLRLTLALGMAPAFDRILIFIQNWTGWNKRNAFGLYLVCFGSLTSLFVFGSIYIFAGPVAFARHA